MKTIKAIKFLSEGTSTISLAKVSNQIDYYILLEYSYNGVDWDRWDFSSLTINQGDALYIRGDNPYGYCRNDEFYTFIIKGDKVSCSGNIMSLIDYRTLPNVIPNSFCFCGLFKNCTALTSAPELPATELTNSCYECMFYGCTSLIKIPKLPIADLTTCCYYRMFKDCILLK